MRNTIIPFIAGILFLSILATIQYVDAHYGATLDSRIASSPAVLDGISNQDEWAGGCPCPQFYITVGDTEFRIPYIWMNDGENLYGSFRVKLPDGFTENSVLTMWFDNDHTGSRGHGDDYMSMYKTFSDGFVDGYWNVNTNNNPEDKTDGGTKDGAVGSRLADGWEIFEFKKPLCSGDSSHDFCLSPGDTLGYSVSLSNSKGIGSWPSSGRDMADLVIAKPPPPSNGFTKLKGSIKSMQDPGIQHETYQLAIILPPSENVYSGSFSYSASEPIQLVALHGPIAEGEDKGQPIWTPDGETKFALTLIPGSSQGAWKFSGNALAVHTTNTEQFTVNYDVRYYEVASTPTTSGTIDSVQDPGIGHENHQLAFILPPAETPHAGLLTYSASVTENNAIDFFAMDGPLAAGEDMGQPIWTPDGETKFELKMVTNQPNMGIWEFSAGTIGLHSMIPKPFTASYSIGPIPPSFPPLPQPPVEDEPPPLPEPEPLDPNLGINEWSFEEIAGEERDFDNNDVFTKIPANLDMYFSTTKDIENKLLRDNILPPERFSIKNLASYDEKKLTLSKRITLDITNYDEYLSVFGKDPMSPQVQFRGNNIDESYIMQQIISSLESCSQYQQPPEYCDKDPELLKAQILNKIGIHAVTESVIVGKFTSNLQDSQIDPSSVPPITPTSYNELKNNITQIDTDFSSSLIPLNEIYLKNNFIPKAMAQSTSRFGSSDLPYSDDFSFLNGFTIGYGFGKTWSYEFNVFGYVPFGVEAHVEAGLGLGLRIPIDATLSIPQITSQSASTDDTKFEAEYKIRTRDLDESGYRALGLHPGQTFEGKEFNIYLGPSAYIRVKLFDETIFEKEKGIPKPESRDFIPPLGKSEEFTSLDVDLLCDVIDFVCIDDAIANIELSAGVSGNIFGNKVTIESDPSNPSDNRHEMMFTTNGQTKPHVYHADSDGSFDTELQNVKYHSELDFVPRIMVGLGSPYLPFPIISESIELPEIEFRNIVLEAHDNTKSEYKIEEVKIFGEGKAIPTPTGSTVAVAGTDFVLSYTTTGGSALSATPDVDATSLIIAIQTTSDGQLTITLPRALIDAKLNGEDDDFFVLVDGELVDFNETKTSTDRTMTISFPNGAEEIEIIGTFVVPEFGTIAMMILGVAIVSVIAITAKLRMVPRF